jgi:hypothetical protein
METSTLELTINRSIIVDQVASFLYAIKAVDDGMGEITNIQFGELFGVSETEHVPIKIHIKGREV